MCSLYSTVKIGNDEGVTVLGALLLTGVLFRDGISQGESATGACGRIAGTLRLDPAVLKDKAECEGDYDDYR